MFVGKKIGPFHVDKELGSGAMGAVYRGRHEETGAKVAIKVVAPGLAANAAALKRFKRETSILKQLDHPNIVKILASGKVQGTPFYVMEYVEGESLDRIMERRGRMSWEELVGIGRQLCAALQHAHDAGIIHRDLKPGNVMVLKDGTVKLADFGIAKDIDMTALTAANSTVGTCAYMSPEQCRGSIDISPKADLYSMGVMFFELVTGRKPFLAETVMEMFMQHTQGKFPRPSRLVMDMPIWLDDLICQLLEKKPDDRPFSAEKVAESLALVKEKWETQQSAAVTAVRKRRADKTSRDVALDATERELGRTLLGKKKKKGDPFYRQTWFTIGSVAGVLLGFVALSWFLFIKPPSAESLYAQAKQLMATKQPEDRRQARDGPVASFLRLYPGHPDKKQIQEWADQVDVEEREQQMIRRRNLGLRLSDNPSEAEAEEAARLALTYEENGRLDEARKRWQLLLVHKDAADADLRAWSLVAEKYLRDLDGANELEVKLRNRVKSEKTAETGESRPEELALKALRAEAKGDVNEAGNFWDDVKHLTKPNIELRRWWLLAANCKRDLDEKSKLKPK